MIWLQSMYKLPHMSREILSTNRSEDQPNLNSKLDDDGTNGDHGNQYKSSGTYRFPQ